MIDAVRAAAHQADMARDEDDPSDWRSFDGELARREVLHSYRLKGPELEVQLNRLAALAAQLCDAPIGLVSLVHEHTQEFLGRSGLDDPRTPREESFCSYAMHEPTVMVVPDATLDPRFEAHPMVTGAANIRFYAGHPLVSPEGAPLGSLCVIDTAPRSGLTPFQTEALGTLADAVMAQLERPRSEDAGAHARGALADLEQRFAVLADAMPQMVWSTPSDGLPDYFNERWTTFTGAPAETSFGAGWLEILHPEDRHIAEEAWNGAVASGLPYEVEYRLRHNDGSYRWVLARGLPLSDGSGAIGRWLGTCTDIHEQKDANDRLETLSQELSHRIKNIFAVIGGLLSLSLRSHPEFAALGRELQGRILALGRAHEFVRPSQFASGGEARASDMLTRLFGAYRENGAERVRIAGDDVPIDDRSATPLALLFHELATNSAKYGALSAAGGHVDLTIRDGEVVTFEWHEHGGPPVSEPTTNGFGRQLMELSVERQLGGTLEFSWPRDGVVFTARVPRSAMHR